MELETDEDKDYLLTGIREGFRIVDENVIPEPVELNNYTSALQHKEVVENQICEEVLKGRYILCSQKPVIVSALGAILKSNNSVRLIHDCSRPMSKSVNDYVSQVDKMSYKSVSDACSLINPGYYMCKVDLRSAYRYVPIHVSNYQFSGLKWTFKGSNQPQYLMDTRLMFGSKLGPSIFHRISQAICRIMSRNYNVEVVAYLDDFFITAPTFDQCNKALLLFIRLIHRLGFDIAWDKLLGPSTNITFLGINIDSVSMYMTLPGEKVDALHLVIQKFLAMKRASKRELQHLAGKLSYASQLVHGGRTYLRRILDVINKLKLSHHKAKLGKGFLSRPALVGCLLVSI